MVRELFAEINGVLLSGIGTISLNFHQDLSTIESLQNGGAIMAIGSCEAVHGLSMQALSMQKVFLGITGERAIVQEQSTVNSLAFQTPDARG